MCSEVSVIIRSLYALPLIICMMYNIALSKKVKKNNYEDRKLFYKLINSSFIYTCFFIYSGTFMIETILFTKWTTENYLICFCILLLLSLLSSIKTRIGAPRNLLIIINIKKSNYIHQVQL